MVRGGVKSKFSLQILHKKLTQIKDCWNCFSTLIFFIKVVLIFESCRGNSIMVDSRWRPFGVTALWSHVKTSNVRMILQNLFNLAFLGTFSSNRSGEVSVWIMVNLGNHVNKSQTEVGMKSAFKRAVWKLSFFPTFCVLLSPKLRLPAVPRWRYPRYSDFSRLLKPVVLVWREGILGFQHDLLWLPCEGLCSGRKITVKLLYSSMKKLQ